MDVSAVILAAGAGTRMHSKRPKVVHEILGKPLVRYVVDAARAAGVDDVVCVVGHGRETVEPLVEDCRVVVQEQQLGTADAVAVTAEAFKGKKGSLLVLSGDCPLISPETLQHLIEVREKKDAAVVCLSMRMKNPLGYGRIIRNKHGKFMRIVEQKDCNAKQAAVKECNSGFYCFDIEALFDALQRVSSENAQGEYYLTDVIEICRKDGREVLAVETGCAKECLGINSRVQLSQASRVVQRAINLKHMTQGVSMTDPRLVWIGPDVQIASDVELLPMTTILGNSTIGTDTVIGPNSRLTDTVVGEGCVLDETVAIEAVLEDGCTCGPRAYLRQGTYMCKGSKAGTHVEIKKSTIGEGSKVPHLSYVGDTTMGSGVNIGAGSVTCNYDGKNKWPTTIGDDTFVGSDTMMVAPVNIGSKVTIGAGSVITNDVPDNALGLGRARQTVIPDYEERKRRKEQEKAEQEKQAQQEQAAEEPVQAEQAAEEPAQQQEDSKES